MPNYRVTHVSGLREKIIVAGIFGCSARQNLGLTVEAYRETILVEKINPSLHRMGCDLGALRG